MKKFNIKEWQESQEINSGFSFDTEILTELNFKTQGAFDAYRKKHAMLDDTEVTVAGKKVTAGEASKAGKKGKGLFHKMKTSIFGKSKKEKEQDASDEEEVDKNFDEFGHEIDHDAEAEEEERQSNMSYDDVVAQEKDRKERRALSQKYEKQAWDDALEKDKEYYANKKKKKKRKRRGMFSHYKSNKPLLEISKSGREVLSRRIK